MADGGGDVTPPTGDRRGIDAALLAVVNARLQDHHREHTAAALAWEERMTALHALLNERDQRYTERFEASQKALDAASNERKQAIAAALESQKEAVDKSETSTIKTAEATFVKIDQLEATVGKLIPREEAESRWGEVRRVTDDLKSRMQAVESRSAGRTDVVPWIVAAVAVIGLILTLTR